ncbi:MAG: hypothetical protein JNL32_00110 [Candidatus Kapabacteria bacterium]|nr:hypothetical protein [Candidatus Kapabacteria bacterium]
MSDAKKKYAGALVAAMMVVRDNSDSQLKDIIVINENTEKNIVERYNKNLDAMIENARIRNNKGKML